MTHPTERELPLSADPSPPVAPAAPPVRAAPPSAEAPGQKQRAVPRWLRPERWRGGALSTLALLTLLGLGLWPFWRLLLLGDVLFDGDTFLAHQVWWRWQSFWLRQGILPVWASHLLGGFPIAFSEYSLLSPLTWAFNALAPGGQGYNLSMAIHFTLALAGMYLFARSLGLARLPAWLSAVLYGYSGYMLASVHFDNFHSVFGYTPLLLYLAGRLRHTPWPWVPLFALLLGLTLLAGHPQLILLAYLLVVLYLALLLSGRILARGLLAAWRPVGWFLVASALGAGLGLYRWLPTLALVRDSVRGTGLSAEAAAEGSVAPHAFLLGLFLPGLEVPRVIRAEPLVFVGVLPLLLAGPALWRRYYRPLVLALLGLAVVSLALSLGHWLPLYALLHKLPALSLFRDPVRYLFPLHLALALLAGFGLQEFTAALTQGREPLARLRGWLLAAGIALVVGSTLAWITFPQIEPALRAWLLQRATQQAGGALGSSEIERTRSLAGLYLDTLRQSIAITGPVMPVAAANLLLAAIALWLPRRFRATGVAAAAAATLVLFYLGRLPTIPHSEVLRPPQALDRVPETTGTGYSARVFAWRPQAQRYELQIALGRLPRPDEARALGYRVPKELLAPNLGADYGAAQLDGYENLMTLRQSIVLAYLGSERAMTPGLAQDRNLDAFSRRRAFADRLPWLGRLGVAYVTTLEGEEFSASDLQLQTAIPLEYASGRTTRVLLYRVADAWPRLFLAGAFRSVGNARTPQELAALVEAGPLTVAREPVVEGSPQVPAGMRLDPARSSARIVAETPWRISIEVQVNAAGLLVLLDTPLPGWKARVDGRETPMYPANLLGRAVALPADARQVEFTYDPPLWTAGILASALSALALLPVSWQAWRARAGYERRA